MKKSILLIIFLITTLLAFSQNCRYGQCSKYKSNGYRCENCVSAYGDYYCHTHSNTNNVYSTPTNNTFSTPTLPTLPTYPSPTPSNDCEYSQCLWIKSDGNRCKRCTGSRYDSYCSSHK